MTLALTTIWSGGQTGADLGGLLAAEDLGLATGGWMPKGWRTEDGPRPEYEARFGMREHASSRYEHRTTCNVADTDLTLLFMPTPSPGSRLTIREAQFLGKPCLVNPEPEVLIAFLRARGVVSANVAGTRESKCPGLTERVRAYLVKTLRPHLA